MNTSGFHILCIIILVTFLSCTVAAADEFELIQVPEKMPWLSANNLDTSTITVQLVNNTTGNPVPGKPILFNVMSENMGTISNLSVNTNETGYSSTVFTTSTKSGLATIRAVLLEDPAVTTFVNQPVDHLAPLIMKVYYSNFVPVAKNTTILVKLYDQNGNPVDNLREKSEGTIAEQAHFRMSSGPSGTGFFTGSWEDVEYNGTDIFNTTHGLSVNGTGVIEANLRMDEVPGYTDVIIYSIPTIGSFKLLQIEGYAEGIPAVIDQTVNPTMLYQPADNESLFSITYHLYDEFSNSLNGKDIQLITPEGEDYITTSADGSAVKWYGPKSEPCVVTITARAAENENVTRTCSLVFYDSSPVYMGITAVPEMVPSRDVGSNINSTIKVKITDCKGKPVAGEGVNFNITDQEVISGTQLQSPYLDSSFDETDDNGVASVHFIPGAFAKIGEEGYNQTSEGSCIVEADWLGRKENVTIQYKNFPFLSIYTSVTTENITAGETVDVTIQVRGEGMPLLLREKVNLVLLTSRAASMLKENPDRMVYTYEAENILLDKLLSSKPIDGPDQVGLMTQGGNPYGVANILYTQQGWSTGDAGFDNNPSDDPDYINAHYPGNGTIEYHDMLTWEQTMTPDLMLVKQQINKTTPCSSTGKNANQNELPFRLGLYESILAIHNSTYKHKAVIALVDSEITDYGDVRAGGLADWNWQNMGGCTNRYYPFIGPDPANPWHPIDKKDKLTDPNQDLAVFAQNSDVKVYIVYAADQLNNCDAANLQYIADISGGHFNSTNGDASKLPQIYDWIASEIMEEAGVETEMSVDMGTLEVNGAWVTYDPNDPYNTSVFDYIFLEGTSTLIKNYYQNGTEIDPPWTKNQTEDFYDDHILHYDIGTIRLHQIWEATYRLLALVNGTVKVPGPNTTITTNSSGLNISYDIPSDWISPLPNTTVKELTYDLTITDFSVSPESTGLASLSWTLDYTGPVENPVLSQLYYRDEEGKWVLIATRHGLTGAAVFNVGGFPSGTVEFRLVASAPRAPTRYAFRSTFIPPGGVPSGIDALNETGMIILK